MNDQFIVAEMTKNWTVATPENSELLSHKFEKVLNTNLARGYKLVDWKLNVVTSGETLTETIIAIFEYSGI